MTGRCLFGFSGEKPFLLPDNEGVKMNTSPVRMDDLPLNRFHCRIAALTFGAHLTDGYVLGVIGYAIIQLTPAMQLTPFMAGMIGGSALLGLFIGSPVLGGSPTILVGKNLHLQLFADYARFVLTIFCHHARASYWTAHFDRHWSGRRLLSRSHFAG